MALDKPQPIVNDTTVPSPPVAYNTTQDPGRLESDMVIPAKFRRPGHEKGLRQELFRESSPTTGSQYGHPNDSSHLWLWL